MELKVFMVLWYYQEIWRFSLKYGKIRAKFAGLLGNIIEILHNFFLILENIIENFHLYLFFKLIFIIYNIFK